MYVCIYIDIELRNKNIFPSTPKKGNSSGQIIFWSIKGASFPVLVKQDFLLFNFLNWKKYNVRKQLS